MARKLSQVIDDENYFEWIIPIGQTAVDYIIDALRDKYTANFKVEMSPNYLMDNLLTISMFFDTQRNRLYLTYKLDIERHIALRVYDTELWNRIFDKLQWQLTNDYQITLSVVGDPTDKPERSRGREYKGNDITSLFLRNDTQYLWTILGQEPNGNPYTYFVENRNMLIDDIKKRLVKDSWKTEVIDGENVKVPIIPEDIMPEYNVEVLEINSRYNFQDPNIDYNAAFAEYQNVYNKYFNRIPENIPEWKSFTIFVNVDHDEDAERMDYYDHPRGKYLNPEEVEHYIAKWGYDHGKYVPEKILEKWGLNRNN